ncbi:unnamed protein product [Lampetra planeri]
MQEAAPDLAREARTGFLQRKRMEDKMPNAFQAALQVLGREAYPLEGEGALDHRVAERLRELARTLRVDLPSAVGTKISSSTVARTIQVFEEQQQRAGWEATAWNLQHMVAAVEGRWVPESTPLRENLRQGQFPLPWRPAPKYFMCGRSVPTAAECWGDD